MSKSKNFFKILKLVTIIFITATSQVFSVETCSRTAIINYQEIMVDTNSNQKGEGLRYHIEKDPIARTYLDKYQKGTKIKWQNTILGTIGSALILSGLLSVSDSKDSNQRMLISGASILSVNYLIARTLENQNKSNLTKAIDEYNKRNIPKIYFNKDARFGRDPSSYKVFKVEKSWRF